MEFQIQGLLGWEFVSLIVDIPTSSHSTLQREGIQSQYNFNQPEEVIQEKLIARAQRLAKEGHISMPVRTLESSPPANTDVDALRIFQTLATPSPTYSCFLSYTSWYKQNNSRTKRQINSFSYQKLLKEH